jgi:hypothetical protein
MGDLWRGSLRWNISGRWRCCEGLGGDGTCIGTVRACEGSISYICEMDGLGDAHEEETRACTEYCYY